jgi:16S rRNA (guanine966-N2)-methyltransferase
VREALFSSLGQRCDGWRVLDLFAGAGSLGLEAWSRGAEHVTFVEKHPVVWKNLQKNIEVLQTDGLGEVRCVKGDAFRFLERAGVAFDLIFADPPYDLPDAMEQTLTGIVAHSVLTVDGVVVYELRSSDAVEVPSVWQVIRDKVYGQTRVLMLKFNEDEE